MVNHFVFAYRPLVQRHCQRLYRNAAGMQDVVPLSVLPTAERRLVQAGHAFVFVLLCT